MGVVNGLTAPGREREGHVGLVYRTAQVRDEAVVDFVGEGLRLGEQVVLATGQGGWESALARHGMDARGSGQNGALTTLDASQFYPAQGQAAMVDLLLGSGRPGVRLVASAEGALAYLGESGFHRVEREMDDLCQTRPIMLFCHLHSDTAPQGPAPRALEVFVDTHARELRGPGLAMHRAAGGVRLCGEVDLVSDALVETALARAGEEHHATGQSEDALVVDLSELTFLDAAGYRALVRGTALWRRRGGTIVLTGAAGTVRRLLQLFGLGTDGDVRLE